MDEQKWDKKLKIHTMGREDSHADDFHFPYEPTPYAVLERLAKSDYLDSENILVDYGCGKGRVDFFLSYAVGCETIGIEFDTKMCQMAEENRRSFVKSQKVSIIQVGAEEYQVEKADRFYFFNPFSVEILQKVLGRILDSYYVYPRPMYLFFYYIHEDFLTYLMTQNEIFFEDEIDCRDLFPGDNVREKILIFSIGA